MLSIADFASGPGGFAGITLPADAESTLDVEVARRRLGDAHVRYEVTLDGRAPAVRAGIYFDVEAPFPLTLAELDDAFVIAAIFPALSRGGTLRTRGPVSRRLARNLLEYQALWLRLRPDLCRPFAFSPGAIVEDAPAPASPGHVLPFTAGVDSMYSLLRNIDPAVPLGALTRPIDACLFIPGFEPRPDRRELYAAATASVRAIAGRAGRPLVVAETDMTLAVPRMRIAHGTLLAAVATLLAGNFAGAVIASSCVIAGEASVAWGSKPLFDPLLSSGRFDIVDDGSELERHEKVAALGRYGDMLADLRVCHMSPTFEGNCGRCTKCRRTIAAFLAAGLPVPAAFPVGAARQRLRHLARRTLAEARSIDAYRYGRFTHQAARNAGVRSLQMRRLGLWLAAVGAGRGIVDAVHRLLGVGDPVAFNGGDMPDWLVRRRAGAIRAAWSRPSTDPGLLPPGGS
jgi:hypothetical protein